MTAAAQRSFHRAAVNAALIVAIVAGSLVMLAAPATSGGFLDSGATQQKERPTWAVPAKRMPVEGDGSAAIEAELENARMRVQEAQQNDETAAWTYKRARTRRYPRGEALQEIKDRAAEMAKERLDAEREMISLVEKARQSGVPAGTLMDYEDLVDQIRADQAQRAAAQ